ncbi:hypothetical protein AOLI_G00244120 [Acnodon oligacanthus]
MSVPDLPHTICSIISPSSGSFLLSAHDKRHHLRIIICLFLFWVAVRGAETQRALSFSSVVLKSTAPRSQLCSQSTAGEKETEKEARSERDPARCSLVDLTPSAELQWQKSIELDEEGGGKGGKDRERINQSTEVACEKRERVAEKRATVHIALLLRLAGGFPSVEFGFRVFYCGDAGPTWFCRSSSFSVELGGLLASKAALDFCPVPEESENTAPAWAYRPDTDELVGARSVVRRDLQTEGLRGSVAPLPLSSLSFLLQIPPVKKQTEASQSRDMKEESHPLIIVLYITLYRSPNAACSLTQSDSPAVQRSRARTVLHRSPPPPPPPPPLPPRPL